MLVEETFGILKEQRAKGVSILMIEQNARSALQMSDYGIVLELARHGNVRTETLRAFTREEAEALVRES